MKMKIINLFDLTNKVAIVTGGAMGIGKAVATILSAAGASVLVADIISQQAGEEQLPHICRDPTRIKYIEADIVDLRNHNSVIETAIETFGHIDILVNNAGVFKSCSILDMTENMWDRTLDLNLKAAAFLAKSVVKVMIEQGIGGRVINISSLDSFRPTGNLSHYDASKGGLRIFTKALAKEVGAYGITVNDIAPGGVATPGATQILGGVSEKQQKIMIEQMSGFAEGLPLKRIGQPEDIGNAALFLASKASSYMTGSTVVVDGGMLLV